MLNMDPDGLSYQTNSPTSLKISLRTNSIAVWENSQGKWIIFWSLEKINTKRK